MIKYIDHINIVVNDLVTTSKFFELLGFKIIHEGDLEGNWISKIVKLKDVRAKYIAMELHESQTKLELIQYYSPVSPSTNTGEKANCIGIRHIAFRVNDIDDMVIKLKSNNIQFLSDVQTYSPTNKKLLYFHGPDGILLELAEYDETKT